MESQQRAIRSMKQIGKMVLLRLKCKPKHSIRSTLIRALRPEQEQSQPPVRLGVAALLYCLWESNKKCFFGDVVLNKKVFRKRKN